MAGDCAGPGADKKLLVEDSLGAVNFMLWVFWNLNTAASRAAILSSASDSLLSSARFFWTIRWTTGESSDLSSGDETLR